MINLSTKESNSTIQANVKRIRMKFGSCARSIRKNYENTNDASKDGSIVERPSFKRQGHTLVFTFKSKRVFFSRVSKILCQICMTKTMVKNGDVSVNCCNCDSDIMVKQT